MNVDIIEKPKKNISEDIKMFKRLEMQSENIFYLLDQTTEIILEILHYQEQELLAMQ